MLNLFTIYLFIILSGLHRAGGCLRVLVARFEQFRARPVQTEETEAVLRMHREWVYLV